MTFESYKEDVSLTHTPELAFKKLGQIASRWQYIAQCDREMINGLLSDIESSSEYHSNNHEAFVAPPSGGPAAASSE